MTVQRFPVAEMTLEGHWQWLG